MSFRLLICPHVDLYTFWSDPIVIQLPFPGKEGHLKESRGEAGEDLRGKAAQRRRA